MKKLTTILVLAAGLMLASATSAQARPVHDEPTYCGPGQTERVYDVRTGGFRTTCLDAPRIPRPAVAPKLDRWWNPWSWIF